MKKALLLSALLTGYLASLSAQAGALDPTFGTNGLTNTLIGTGPDLGRAIALTPDGKILQIGSTVSGVWGYYHIAVARYLPNGAPDYSFGDFGKTVVPTNDANDYYAHALALQSDQKILVAGSGLVVRLLPEGGLDLDFGYQGTTGLATEEETNLAFAAVTPLPDGKILLAGSVCDLEQHCAAALWRLTADGFPDSTWGLSGRVLNTFNGANAAAHGLALQPDGKIVLAGEANGDFALARYLANGTLDSTFGQNGAVALDFGGLEQGRAVVVQADGKILVAGNRRPDEASLADFAAIRLLTDGTPDPDFGTGGQVLLDFQNHHEEAFAVALQNDQKILLGGTRRTALGQSNWALARLLPNGTSDVLFGQNGRVATELGTVDEAIYGLAIQPNGRIVAGGYGYQTFAVGGYLGTATSGAADLTVEGGAVTLFPNPAAGGQFFLKNTHLAPGRYECRITDLVGRLVYTEWLDLGENDAVNVQLPRPTSGCRVVELRQNGRSVWRERLTVVL